MSSTPIPIVVLASGRGSNFSAILDHIQSGKLNANVLALISNKEDAACLKIAQKNNIPSLLIQDEGELLQTLKKLNPRFLVLAGYMRIIPNVIIDMFKSEKGYSRIVNIHPSLLPSFPGLNSYKQAFEYGALVTGVTVHLVTEGIDEGPICAQESFNIVGMSLDEIEEQGLSIEHRLFSETLSWVLEEKFTLEKTSRRSRCVRQG